MEIIGIICEYNPFHNGHLYHINNIKKMYPDSLLILILNGYFLERGEISLISKSDKVKIALENKIDLVVELPVIFGTQSADTFANIAVTILNKFHVNKIIFGSECNDINTLTNIAKKSIQIDDTSLKRELKKGTNYATALANLVDMSFIFNPNDLLGISYIKSILKNNFDIKAETILRTNNYHDLKANDSIISASNIRNKLNNHENIKKYLPMSSYNKINKLDKSLFFNLLKLNINTNEFLNEYLDVDEGIEYLLKKQINKANTLEEFIKLIKSKRYTYNRLNRMFIHILLGLKKKDANINLDYIKILGFNKNGKKYLNEIKKDINLQIDKNSKIFLYEIRAAILYDMLSNSNLNLKFEQSNKPIF